MKKKNNQDEQVNQNVKIGELEESNKNLQEKLKLLRIQLMSQSQLQLASFNHSRSASLNRSRMNLHSSRLCNPAASSKIEDHGKPSPGRHPESILNQLSILQEELDNVKEQHRNRITELEKQIAKTHNSASPTKLKQELNENVELIKLKRLSKKQSANILSLQSQLELSNTELKQLQTNLLSLTNDKDHLQTKLSNEKCENAKLQSDISTLKENTLFLEEQINDLKKEKNTLKEHNENLLKLSLQQRVGVGDSNKSNFSKQIKELQESLQKEILAKCELSSKLTDAELSIAKYKNELTKNSSLISDLRVTNQSIKNEVEHLQKTMKDNDVTSELRMKVISTEEKSVMTSENENDKAWSVFDNNFSVASDLNNGDDSNFKMQLYNITQELNQCKELLRVQYGLNNKYKKEVEELQKIFQKSDKLNSDNLRRFQTILRKHEDRLSEIKRSSTDEHLKSIFIELNKIFAVKKLGSYPDYLNCIEKLLASYVLFVENSIVPSDRLTCEEKGTITDKFIPSFDKTVQVNAKKELVEIGDEYRSTVVPEANNTIENMLDKTTPVVFELRIGRADFDYFSDHLMKSSGNNPNIFLTWNFLNDNEHQAYTPTVAVEKGAFDCSCQYEGYWSEFLHTYLKEHGVLVEIHFVQGEISIRLAETKIDTSSVLNNPDKFQMFTSEFENDNVRGRVTGTFILRCGASVKNVM